MDQIDEDELGRSLKRMLDEAETGISRPNWLRIVMVMIFTGSLNFFRDKCFISYFSFKTVYWSECYCNSLEIIVVCVCVCVCMYVCMYVCIYEYIYLLIYLFIHSFCLSFFCSFFQSSVFLKRNTPDISPRFVLAV